MSEFRIGFIGNEASFQTYETLVSDLPNWQLVAAHDPHPIPAVDALIVGEISATAPARIEAMLSQGRSVLITNPSGLSVENMIALRRAERGPGAGALHFGFKLRALPCVQKALATAKAQTFGRLLTLRAAIGTPNYDPARPGAMNQHGLDMIDLLFAFAGPFVDVKAFVDEHIWPGEEHGADTVFALLRTHDHITASLHASSVQWRRTFRLELTYENGTIWLDRASDQTPACWPDVLVLANRDHGDRADPGERIEQFPAFDPIRAQLLDFLSSLEGKAATDLATSAEAFDTVNLAERILADDQTWTPQERKAL